MCHLPLVKSQHSKSICYTVAKKCVCWFMTGLHYHWVCALMYITGKENGLFESDFLKHQYSYFV